MHADTEADADMDLKVLCGFIGEAGFSSLKEKGQTN